MLRKLFACFSYKNKKEKITPQEINLDVNVIDNNIKRPHKRRSLPIVINKKKRTSSIKKYYSYQKPNENIEFIKKQTLRNALSLYDLEYSKTSSFTNGCSSEPMTIKSSGINNDTYINLNIDKNFSRYTIPKTSIDLKRIQRPCTNTVYNTNLSNNNLSNNKNSIDDGVAMHISSSLWNTIIPTQSSTSK